MLKDKMNLTEISKDFWMESFLNNEAAVVQQV